MPGLLRVQRWLLPIVLLWACALSAQAALQFPALTGRVVDNAQMLDGQTRTQLSQMLEAHEQATGEQVVVVTLPDLQGASIEDFGYQLGRSWGIGEKGKDSGALLIVARDERKVRIEVGYGLEERLTDAQSSVIINQVITPAFRNGDFVGGISKGAQAMVQVLGGNPLAEPAQMADEDDFFVEHGFLLLGLIVLAIVVLKMSGFGGSGRGGGGGFIGGGGLGGFGGGLGGGSGGGGGGGFSGGGGSFGGGGSSGNW